MKDFCFFKNINDYIYITKASKGPNRNPGLVCWELYKHFVGDRSFPKWARNEINKR